MSGQLEVPIRVAQNRTEQNTAQHSTTQHSTAQHSTAQHSTAQHSTAQYSTAQHSTAQYSTAQHSTAQHSTAQHSTAQHSTAQHSTAKQSKAKQSKAQHHTKAHQNTTQLAQQRTQQLVLLSYSSGWWGFLSKITPMGDGFTFITRSCVYNGCVGCHYTHVSDELDPARLQGLLQERRQRVAKLSVLYLHT